MRTLTRDELRLLQYGVQTAIGEHEWLREREEDLPAQRQDPAYRHAAVGRLERLTALRDKLAAILDSTLDIGEAVKVEPIPYAD